MLMYIRYALASVCFAASVACLALWWRSVQSPYSTDIFLYCPRVGGACSLDQGRASVRCYWISPPPPGRGPARRFEVATFYVGGAFAKLAGNNIDASEFEKRGRFGYMGNAIYFPFWYPALVVALAGVSAIRFRRQFSTRLALICVSVVALLLGIVVAL